MPNNKNTKKTNVQLEGNTKIFQKRKLDTKTGYYDGTDSDYYFAKLSIFLDLAEYHYTLPSRIIEYNDAIISAMNRAKEILESLFEIAVKKDHRPLANNFKYNHCFSHIHKSASYSEGLDLNKNNFFVIVQFVNPSKIGKLNDDPGEHDSFHLVIQEQVENSAIPLIGIILLRDTMEDYKLKSLDFLTNLFIQNFIKLLGFHVYNNNIDKSPYIYKDCVPSHFNIGFICKFGSEFCGFQKSKNYLMKYYNIQDYHDIDIQFYGRLTSYIDDAKPCSYAIEYMELFKERLLGDILASVDYPEEQIVSGFTLNFLDDFYYLNLINHNFPDLMKFGKNKGIFFLKGIFKVGCALSFDFCNKQYLSNNESVFKSFDNEFYIPRNYSYFNAERPSCSSARLSKTKYKLNQGKDDDTIFLQLNSPNCSQDLKDLTGEIPNIFCPIPRPFDESYSTSIYSGHCSEINFAEKDDDRYETLGDHSFCVLSSLVNKDDITDKSFKSLCYEMFCSALSLTIKVGEYYIVCPREGGQIKVKYFTGYLLCPDYNLICSNTVLCNSLYNCLKKNSEIKATAFDYDYDIKTTQDPSVYDVPNPVISYGWEKTNDGICPYFCSQCTESTCVQCRPHYKVEKNKCVVVIEHCIEFINDIIDTCIKCNSGYFLAEDSNGNRTCEEESKKK